MELLSSKPVKVLAVSVLAGLVSIVFVVAFAVPAPAAIAPAVAAARGDQALAPAGPQAVQEVRFSGNGGKALRPFRLSSPSTMIWTNTGSIFQIFGSGTSNNGTINSTARRGTTYMPVGRYALQVNAIGSWTILIRTGIERLSNPIRFVGNGGKALPPFRLASRKTMYWTNTGSIFQTFPSGFSINGMVNSQAHRGTTSLPAGRYQLQVNAIGNWTITVK